MNGTIERIVVALDAVSESRMAIAAAVRLATRWKTRLHGVFVEDDDLIRFAHLPFARQVTLGIGAEPLNFQQAERQLRVFAERARQDLAAAARPHDIEWSFEVLRDAGTTPTVAAAIGDLLVAGTTTRPIGGYFRVECRWWSVVEAGSAPFLLAHREGHPADGQTDGAVVAVLPDRGAASERLLAAAARLAEADGGRLVVLCAPSLADTPGFKAWLDERLAGRSVEVEIDATLDAPAALIPRLDELGCRVVALAAEAAEARPERLRELVGKIACDVLVVR